MPHPVLGIDHSYLLVHDLDASSGLYRRLGFTLSPRGLHSAAKGTANYTIVFRDDYLELLGVVAETPANQLQRDRLARQGEGLQAIANRTEDADAARTALAARGILTGEVSSFSRPLRLLDGSQGQASFRTLTFDPVGVPLGHFFLCEHKTRDLVWRPELQHHENGAEGLAGIVGVSADPEVTATTFASFYADGRVTPDEGGFRVETGKRSAPLLLVSRDAARDLFAGQNVEATPAGGFAALRVSVRDEDWTRRVLYDNDVPFTETRRGSLVVRPEYTSGVILEFIQS